jgi:amino acid permease
MVDNEATPEVPAETTEEIASAPEATNPTQESADANNEHNEELEQLMHQHHGDEGPTQLSMTRRGTISSACFNLLSTMVGGGSLSLPLAFQQAGNGLLAPLILIITALITEFSFRNLVACAPTPVATKRGTDSFESIARSAFGSQAHLLSTLLVYFMCFFGTVGYAVLLRDMLQPITDVIWSQATRQTRNLGMLSVVLLVTPLCGLETLTSLEKFGATSMVSVLILGTCVMIRSLQCVANIGHWDVHLWPESPRLLLDAIPLFISCYVCHYNVHPVHNDLQNPSPKRVSRWLRLTTWSATAFYMAIGLSGSLYAACTPDGRIQGNVLLSFDEEDPLLMVGRLCLALTVTLAFPMLTIPARDIALRSIREQLASTEWNTRLPENDLEEPLLDSEGDVADFDEQPAPGLLLRMVVAIVVFWSGAAVACCVSSIDVVWDLLGSSLSISKSPKNYQLHQYPGCLTLPLNPTCTVLSYLIPFGTYLVLRREDGNKYSKILCWVLLGLFVPLMFVSTGNAIVNTFLKKGGWSS